MVICQGRLDSVVPLENATMPDRRVIQWDKDDCADMGIVKVDLLGLGMMAVLQDTLAMVNSAGLGAPAARAEGESASPAARASGANSWGWGPTSVKDGCPRALKKARQISQRSVPSAAVTMPLFSRSSGPESFSATSVRMKRLRPARSASTTSR
jgi:hypothetical protein